jgi:hypothetical protein
MASSRTGFCLTNFAAIILSLSSLSAAQNPDKQEQITFHASTSLVLVDVIAQDPKHELEPGALKQDDFEIRDNGHPTAIVSFDDRTSFGSHPVALWFVVICSEGNNPDGSEKFIGKEESFRPALDSRSRYDRVGVAHWCDNGEAEVDLSPSSNRDAAVAALARALKPIAWTAPAPQYRRLGELAFQWMLELLIEQAHVIQPESVPVIVCLYGDHSGQPIPALEHLLDYLLSTSGFVYGIKDRSTSDFFAHVPGNQPQVLHYLAEQTGGQYFAERPDQYAAALAEIIAQVHARYGLGIHPIPDGKRHKLTVEFTKATRQRFKSLKLRYRTGYTSNFPLRTLVDPVSVAVHDGAPIPRRLSLQAKVSEPTAGGTHPRSPAVNPTAQRYVVEYSIPESELKFATDFEGNHVYSVELVAFVFDSGGNKLDEIRSNMVFTITADHFPEVRQDGVRARQIIDVSDRAALLRLLARDQLGGDIGSLNVTLSPTNAAQ